MCGICGEIRYNDSKPNPQSIYAMMKSMATRGPEEEGMILYDTMAFGHRRLKIIDLSEHSRQPMSDSHLGFDIVFNGAIYNYPDLRNELEQKGYTFFSKGDTEVIIKAYHAWGEEFVTHLNGMFALALWEREKKKLILARDRCGIKPLYYTNIQGGIRFASSLTALLTTDAITKEINPVALHYFMTFHAVVPAPLTILKDIFKVPPASIIIIDHDNNRIEKNYWRASYIPNRQKPYEELKEELICLITKSVKRRLIADVPVGVLLSGGIDSSLIVALLAHLGKCPINTFSIGFEDVADEKGNEFYYSDLVSDYFATKHQKIHIKSIQLLDSLEACVMAMSEPMVSHDNIGFFLLSQEISKYIKVVQSGQGADEIFGGYMWYPPLMDSKNAVKDYSRFFFDISHAEFCQAICSPYVSEDFSRQFVTRHFEQEGAEQTIDKALRLDTTVMLVEDPVKRVDNMTMAWGLEARVPFLDHEIVKFAAKIPSQWKIHNGIGKYILKESARKLLPEKVIDRSKRPFPVPALKYIKGPYLDMVHALLESDACRKRAIFRHNYIRTLLQSPLGYMTPLQMSKLWQIALLEFWCQLHLD